uniref:Uncharacterized protein n=1 Tax=Arundo donax TaxID=35708 RepID=A0A0A9HTS9_ARUDO
MTMLKSTHIETLILFHQQFSTILSVFW